jgi:site-specific DNA recombinase
MTKVAAYLRVSTEEQAEQNISLPAQKSRLIQYCQARDWDIHDFYSDDGHTGKNLDRPAMKKLIFDARQKEFDMVLVIKLDRLSRRQQHVLYLIEDVFLPNEIGFNSVTESFDTTNPMGRAVLGIMAAFAQLERETIVERVTDAKREAAKQGRFMGGPPPFGYNHDSATKSVAINTEQSEIVTMIYNEYLTSQMGYQRIADILNERKIKAPQVKYWGKETVAKILSNPFYAGYLPHKGQLYAGQHAAIIAKEKWHEVQNLLSNRSNSFSKPGNFLLAGNIYCGECGARMRSKTTQQQYPKGSLPTRYYVCYSQDGSAKHMVKDPTCKCGYKRAIEIENFVVNELKSISKDKDLIIQIYKEMIDIVDMKFIEKKINQFEKEITQLKKRIDKWYDAYERDSISATDMAERVNSLQVKRKLLENQISDLQVELTCQSDRVISVNEFLETIDNFEDVWEECTTEEQKIIINALIKAIKVYKDNHIELVWPE